MRKLALFGILLIAVFGCRGKGGGEGGGGKVAGRTDHVLVWPMPNDPTKLDPASVEDGDTIDVLSQVYEGLVTWNEKTEPTPNLAEKWDVSPDGLTYTFHLKKGVKFHNGAEMTAEDVKYSWDRACIPSVQSTTADSYMEDIVGFDAMRGASATAKELSGLKVLDPYTIEVHIKQVKPYWPMYLTYPCFFVVPKGTPLKPITTAEMVGTGPFKLGTYSVHQYVELDRFDDYQGGKPLLEKVRRPIQKDAQIRRQLYENGEADWIQLERQDKPMVDANPELKKALGIIDRPAIWYVSMNQNEYAPFKDKRVRQAFAMAIDKDRIIKDVFDNLNERAEGIIPPGVPGYDASFKGLPYDPAGATKLLADAGFPNGTGLPALKMNFRVDRADARNVAQAIQQDLDKNLGVKFGLQGLEWGTMLKLRSDGKLPFVHLRWHADYPDPQNFLSFMLRTGARENTIGYSNPTFDSLCDRADHLMNQSERLKLYAQAMRIVVDDAPWIPIYFQRDLELKRPELTGIRRSLMGPLPLTTADIVFTKQ